jgi:hypothetical protein
MLMAAGGLAAIIVGGRPWYTVPGVDVSFSGTDVSGGLSQALPAVALAGALLMLTLRTVGRKITGVVVGLDALGIVAAGLFPGRPDRSEVTEKVRQTSLGHVGHLVSQPWNLGYAAGGVLVLAGALAMVLYAHRWPRRPDRFARNPGRAGIGAGRGAAGTDRAEHTDDAGRPAPTKPGAGSDPNTDTDAIWKAIDAGIDPTDPGPGEGR